MQDHLTQGSNHTPTTTVDPRSGEKVSFADLRKQKARDQFHSSGINITYNEKEDLPKTTNSSGSGLQRSNSTRQQQADPSSSGGLTSWASKPQAGSDRNTQHNASNPSVNNNNHNTSSSSNSGGEPTSSNNTIVRGSSSQRNQNSNEESPGKLGLTEEKKSFLSK